MKYLYIDVVMNLYSFSTEVATTHKTTVQYRGSYNTQGHSTVQTVSYTVNTFLCIIGNSSVCAHVCVCGGGANWTLAVLIIGCFPCFCYIDSLHFHIA